MSAVVDEVVRLERELLGPATRADRARLEQLLHPDFVEVGRSGRWWRRDDSVDALVGSPDPGEVQVHDLVAQHVADDVVLVTYTARQAATAVRRASVWVRHRGTWVVRYHQGTPVTSSG